jgi:hypothetical protein
MATSTEAAMQRFRIANSVSCLDISLIECPPAVQEVYSSKPARDMSVSGALVEDEELLNGCLSGKHRVMTPPPFLYT